MKSIITKKKVGCLVLSGVLLALNFSLGTSSAKVYKLPGFKIPQFAIPKKHEIIKCKRSKTKNFIVMISDGCGYNHIDAASYYQNGKAGTQIYEQFPLRCAMSTFSQGSYNYKLAWESFGYVMAGPTDSAAASTAISTGTKTYDSAIGVDSRGLPVKNIAERAEELGKSTGVVTSVQISHATPAGFIAHNTSRSNYMDIAKEMIISSKTDVIMGAGNPWFDNNGIKLNIPNSFDFVGGESVWEGLGNGTLEVADSDGDRASDKWKLVQTKSEFQNLKSGIAPKRVLGVAEVYSTLQQARSGDTNATAYAVPLNENVPSLADMTSGALNVLDDNENGFLLMIEGGAVDWASHSNQSGRMIEEEISFNMAVDTVVDWVKNNSSWEETLLIVTGDHETGYLTGPSSDPDWKPIVNNGIAIMPDMYWNSSSHTNSLVPFFAKGADTRFFLEHMNKSDFVRGKYIDNTDIAKVIFQLLDLSILNY